MLNKYNKFNELLEDAENLNKFFGVLCNFNWNQPINGTVMRDFEEYFAYRWENYKNHVFDESYKNIWAKMPEETLDKIKY